MSLNLNEHFLHIIIDSHSIKQGENYIVHLVQLVHTYCYIVYAMRETKTKITDEMI